MVFVVDEIECPLTIAWPELYCDTLCQANVQLIIMTAPTNQCDDEEINCNVSKSNEKVSIGCAKKAYFRDDWGCSKPLAVIAKFHQYLSLIFYNFDRSQSSFTSFRTFSFFSGDVQEPISEEGSFGLLPRHREVGASSLSTGRLRIQKDMLRASLHCSSPEHNNQRLYSFSCRIKCAWIYCRCRDALYSVGTSQWRCTAVSGRTSLPNWISRRGHLSKALVTCPGQYFRQCDMWRAAAWLDRRRCGRERPVVGGGGGGTFCPAAQQTSLCTIVWRQKLLSTHGGQRSFFVCFKWCENKIYKFMWDLKESMRLV